MRSKVILVRRFAGLHVSKFTGLQFDRLHEGVGKLGAGKPNQTGKPVELLTCELANVRTC